MTTGGIYRALIYRRGNPQNHPKKQKTIMDMAWIALKNIAGGQKAPVGRKLTSAVGGAEGSVLFNAREGRFEGNGKRSKGNKGFFLTFSTDDFMFLKSLAIFLLLLLPILKKHSKINGFRWQKKRQKNGKRIVKKGCSFAVLVYITPFVHILFIKRLAPRLGRRAGDKRFFFRAR